MLDILSDVGLSAKLVLEASGDSLLRAWLRVPFGLMLFLVACFGVDVLFKHVGLSFPASVACLIILFLALLLSEWLLGNNRTRKVVSAIDVPAGWSLRWINVFFIPTFVLLPLSPPIGIVEVFKIIAVFLIGFVVMMVLTAYMTRGLQIITGSSKKSHAQRADELGPPTDEIPMTHASYSQNNASQSAMTTPGTMTPREESGSNLDTIAPPPVLQGVSSRRVDEQLRISLSNSLATRPPAYAQTPLPPARPRLWAAYVSAHLDWVIYILVFLIGIPVYYTQGYAMPLHLSLTVLAYYAALMVPPTWRRFLHPVLVSALLIVLTAWVLGLAKGQDLHSTLTQYRSGLKYLQLWEGTRTSNALPGAGDVLGTVLDASIVSLALPMYQYRRELREHFIAIIAPNIVLSIVSIFAYPAICFAIGIGQNRSLAFGARSLTLALATPAVENLAGDINTGAAVAIMSGITGALVGQQMLAWMKIPEDDYVTRGVTLGANSSAIATAMLLKTDPRAAALSSLSMSLFGTITVLFTSIPSIREVIRSLVGL
ncbi:hypothetical protein GQ53DRAFT_724535 [Thozetella sp. PMI_491]|nr:hypothetical protein GQ53DRAFT_724535 [Thozetella sp. PMI_491]